MPIPLPKNDSREEFIKRCMSDETMISEYSEEQRFAICRTTWENNSKLLNTNMDKKDKTFSEVMSDFKNGIGEQPKVHVHGKTLVEEKGIKAVLTREMMDRDGEMVMIDGISLDNFKNNPILLDSHNMNGSVIDNVLGRVENLAVRVVNGAKELVGDLIFASTPRGMIAKQLVEDGFVKTVSMGFGVPMDGYDPESGRITKSELYELSVVSVPANVGALIGKSFKGDDNEVVKMLKNYRDIKPKIKEYRRLFMDDKLFEKLGITKTGDELIDLKAVFDVFYKSIDKAEEVVETPQPEVPQVPEAPTETPPQLTADTIAQLVEESVEKIFQQA